MAEPAVDTESDTLIEEYREYVQRIASALIRRMGIPPSMRDELEAAGYLGLVEAARRFDRNSGHQFKSYAFLRIRGAIIDSIRRSSEISEAAYRHARAVQAALSLREELRQNPAQSPGVGKRLDELSSVLELTARSALIYRLSTQETESELTIPEESLDNPHVFAEKRDLLRKVRALVATLPKKERTVIEGYYFAGKTFSDLARRKGGLSKSWISRIHARALKRLLDSLEAEVSA